MKKSIGQNIITTSGGNQELITGNVVLAAFYVKNEDSKDIFIKINGGDALLLQPNEMFDMSDITNVESCIVVTSDAKVRWGGLI